MSGCAQSLLRTIVGTKRILLSRKMGIYTGFPPPTPTYGGKYVITMLPGLGVGKELMNCVRATFNELGVPLEFQEINVDKAEDAEKELNYISMAVRRNSLALSGIMGYNKTISMDIQLRANLKLDQNIARIRSIPSIPCKYENLDIAVVRINTGVEFSMLEHSPVHGVVTCLKIITEEYAAKVCTFAFEYAKANNRKKVTAVHKANIMKLTDGLFLAVARRIAKNYPEIQLTDMIVDNCCMQLVAKPQQFDVIVTTNLYGMMVAHVLMGLTGGPGLAAAYNVGKNVVVFESAARSIALDIAGKNLVNPVAMLTTSVDMMKYIGFRNHADLLQAAIDDTILKRKIRTKDIGGRHSTSQVLDNILQFIQSNKTCLECNKV